MGFRVQRSSLLRSLDGLRALRTTLCCLSSVSGIASSISSSNGSECLQYMSASVPVSSSAFLSSRIRHNHSGYSLSSIATGSFFPLIKLSPFRGVPAGTEDMTIGNCGFGFASMPCAVGEADGGVEKGWAADVEVAVRGWDSVVWCSVVDCCAALPLHVELNCLTRCPD